MSRETSLYLDAVRFIAALIVCLGHFATGYISGGLFWQIAPLRHDAVIVFFVLSGFVIAHAVDRGGCQATTYVVDRAARIYSVAIPALCLTVALDQVAFVFDPHYCDFGCGPGPLWAQIITGVTFTNQIWNLQMFPGTNGPYWSLGFEIPYYAAFGLFIFMRGPWRVFCPVLLLTLAGPTITALFPLWLAGVAVYRFRYQTLPQWAGWTLVIGSALIWSLIEIWALSSQGWILDFVIPGIARDRIVADYVTGIAFAANLTGFRVIGHRLAGPLLSLQLPIRWLAAHTFTLYLLHFPLMKFMTRFLPWGHKAPATWAVTLTATALIVVVFAALFEQRKQPWRRFFAAGMVMAQSVRRPG